MSESCTGVSITILLPAGRLPLDLMQKAHNLAQKHGFDIYLSLMQNLRLINVPESVVHEVKGELAALGANFKGPGEIPDPSDLRGKTSLQPWFNRYRAAQHQNPGTIQHQEKDQTKAKNQYSRLHRWLRLDTSQ